ncbi:hypothetical protein H257_15026 [Aphanomyces astaci]|uniref:Endonuclease n=1 Tax=Aphanomyces astaci TaxID=112090 RepID=W4FNY4_APHAT|nr:hypothetical protein H257_15026 [Aphanomyces astaci]ETV69197.1 hypothetical protein H257_15026 [Aphanomyces astaci]|eukprot:XP_009841299.1 hypothetical protein H257_15026 [Aphanomyces astaci]
MTSKSKSITVAPIPSTSYNFYIHLDGHSLSYNCERRTADRWNYTLATDKKAATRPSSFDTDQMMSKECNQFKTKSYASTHRGFDRGHLVASSMMTDSPEQRRGSHYMTNIAPQRIYTWGGILYTDDSNDYFLDSHGIRTPDFWWKVVLTKDDSGADKIISWFFPNQENLGSLDSLLASLDLLNNDKQEVLEAANNASGQPTITTSKSITVAPIASTSYNFYIHLDGHSLSYNCERRTADRWNYTLATDKKAATRPSSFDTDQMMSKECNQFKTKSYASTHRGFDRGHLVASSMMTDSPEQRRGSHYMTNIAPQRIYTWGGILYTDDSNDYFLDSHGIRTPDFWWKVVLTKDDSGADKIISWFFPNQENLGSLDSLLGVCGRHRSPLDRWLGGHSSADVPQRTQGIDQLTQAG